jgi:CheY-like chemotaxis protein
MMPKMDGIEAVRIIRDMGYKFQIVALTANALVGQEEVYLKNGFDGFVSKPIDSRVLDSVLNTMIRDKKPAETVSAARKKRNAELSGKTEDTDGSASEMDKLFALDAANTIAVLEEIMLKMPDITDDETEDYITAVHGIKSALANVGEMRLSRTAFRLEKAGKARDFGVIAGETVLLIEALKEMCERIKERKPLTVEYGEEEKALLRGGMGKIIAACERFDRKTAKAGMEELKDKVWPERIGGMLDNLAVYLLHSAFKKAAAAAGEIIEEMDRQSGA